jgi:predicted glycoside hydrolase/deacetylase ChbG (UPF0249 family)
MNRAVTDGIIRGFSHGLLTSTAIMANAPDAARALDAWRTLEQRWSAGILPSAEPRRLLHDAGLPFDFGIHLNLTQGRPLTGKHYPAELLDRQGQFCGIGSLFRRLYRAGTRFHRALRSELAAQIEFLLEHGHSPTHLNGHQYIEIMPGLCDVVRELVIHYKVQSVRVARESGLFRTTILHGRRPASWCLAHTKRFFAGRFRESARGWNVHFADAYFGTAHAGRINLAVLRQFLESGRHREHVEIGLHPASGLTVAIDADSGWNDPLAALRPKELELLTNHSLVELLQSFGFALGRLSRQKLGKAAEVA